MQKGKLVTTTKHTQPRTFRLALNERELDILREGLEAIIDGSTAYSLLPEVRQLLADISPEETL